MRFVSWNIRHGGGKSALRIVEQLEKWAPDVVGLQEYRGTEPSRKIAAGLQRLGLVHQVHTVNPDKPSENRLLLASRVPVERQPASGQLHEAGRWLHVTLQAPFNLHLIVLHVPNRGEGGHDKYAIHDEVVAHFQRLQHLPVLACGDTNTGVPGVDEEAPYFNTRERDWFTKIHEFQWQDVWRQRNPESREYTWRTHQGVGFRLDQLFASPAAAPCVLEVCYDAGEKLNGKTCSDHAALLFTVGEGA